MTSDDTLYQAVVLDPVTEAVFAEHGVASNILSYISIKQDSNESNVKLANVERNGIRIIEASLNASTEEVGETAHKLVHAILDAIKKEQYDIFVIVPDILPSLNQEVRAFAREENTLKAIKRYLPKYAIAFSDTLVARRYLEASLRKTARQLVQLTFSPEEKDVLNKIRVASIEFKCHAYLVGGCIRDKLLGIDNNDLDFMVTTDDLERFVDYVTQRYSLRKPVHLERSDAYTLRIGSMDVDIVEARKVYTPLLPFEDTTLEGDEEFSIALDDAFRRDLTINALMYDLNNNKVLDPTERGFKDLQAGIVNSIIDPFVKYRITAPDMLRALRFAAVLDFKLGPEMLEAMKSNAQRIKPRDKGGDISTRRIRRELRKAAETPEAWYRMKRLLAESGVIDYIVDDVEDVESDRKGSSPKDIEK